MTPERLRQKLMEEGMTWDEAQDEVYDMASDAYDKAQDDKPQGE